MSESESFVQFLAHSHIVVFIKVELNIHVKFHQFLHLNFVASIGEFLYSEIFDSDVHIWQFIVISIIEVSQSNPFVHKP